MIPYVRKILPYEIMTKVKSFLLIGVNSFLLIDGDGGRLLLKAPSGKPLERQVSPYTSQATPFTRKISPYTSK